MVSGTDPRRSGTHHIELPTRDLALAQHDLCEFARRRHRITRRTKQRVVNVRWSTFTDE